MYITPYFYSIFEINAQFCSYEHKSKPILEYFFQISFSIISEQEVLEKLNNKSRRIKQCH